jgi:hypothetical protein
MNIIVRIITGAIQDADGDSYRHVTIVYVILAGGSVVVSVGLVALSLWSIDLGNLQWTRQQRLAKGELWNERKRRFHEENGVRNVAISSICLGLMGFLVLGSWAAFWWGVATGNND